jgi:hypothetical protein
VLWLLILHFSISSLWVWHCIQITFRPNMLRHRFFNLNWIQMQIATNADTLLIKHTNNKLWKLDEKQSKSNCKVFFFKTPTLENILLSSRCKPIGRYIPKGIPLAYPFPSKYLISWYIYRHLYKSSLRWHPFPIYPHVLCSSVISCSFCNAVYPISL